MADLSNQEKLEQVYKLSLENNQMLHDMRNRERVAIALNIIYWLVIIGSIFGAYYYVKPMVDVVVSNKSKLDQAIIQFEEFQKVHPEMRAFEQFINKLRGQGEATTTE
jgi:hypothetical protein